MIILFLLIYFTKIYLRLISTNVDHDECLHLHLESTRLDYSLEFMIRWLFYD